MPDCRETWTLVAAVLSLGLSACSDDASLGSNDLFDETSSSVSSNGAGMSSSSNGNGMTSSSTSDASTSTASTGSGAGGSDAGASASSDAGVTGSSTSSDGMGGSGGSDTTDVADASTTSGTGGGGSGGTTDDGSTGTGGDTTSTTTTGMDCETDALCTRPYECAVSCNAEPVYVGCCQCEEGLIDQFIECREVECGNTTCASDEYCARPVGECDAPSEAGSCVWRPQGCTGDFAPVCGCDGETYSNACVAAGAGVSIAREGACESGL